MRQERRVKARKRHSRETNPKAGGYRLAVCTAGLACKGWSAANGGHQ
jgi:hypothetical protein